MCDIRSSSASPQLYYIACQKNTPINRRATSKSASGVCIPATYSFRWYYMKRDRRGISVVRTRWYAVWQTYQLKFADNIYRVSAQCTTNGLMAVMLFVCSKAKEVWLVRKTIAIIPLEFNRILQYWMLQYVSNI